MLVESVRAWPSGGVEMLEVDLTPRLPRRDFVRACEFMRWCRKDSFRLHHLCRFLGTSEERFTRLFRASASDSPASFYNRMLLDRACDYLRDRELSIKEIGYELGYKTTSHFIAAFRRQFGRTPTEFRGMAVLPAGGLRIG
jgi:AraC-like DNA-binding protein